MKPFGLRARLLLVLAVLAGVVAMHGLGPQAVPAAAHAAESATGHASAHAAAMTAAGHDGSLPTGTHGAPAEPGGGHPPHADATCAAAGIGGAPVMPAPGPVTAGPETACAAYGITPETAAGGRPPPSLSELQLLRI